MRSCFSVIIAALLLGTVSFAADIKYGSLNVFTKDKDAQIFIDGEFRAKEKVQIKEIQAGTHFLKVTSGEATAEATIFAEVVNIEPGEVTTIYIADKTVEEKKRNERGEEVDVFKTKRVLDYSKEMHTGWYTKIGYLTNLYYNLESPSLDNYASTIAFGLGFRIALAPNIDFSLEMDRAELASSKDTWYFMPVTANILISYLPSPYFRGKQYYGLGIGYYITNLQDSLKHDLTTLGYHLYYGLEMPSGDKNAFFIEFGSHMADISRYDYILNSYYASVGYRWDVKE